MFRSFIKILRIILAQPRQISLENIKVEIVSRLYYFADIGWKKQIQTLLLKEEVMEVAEAIEVVDMEAADMEEEDEVVALEVQDHFGQRQLKLVTNMTSKLNQ
jgi:NTP pyrophosphatase (non-canonical NTP hydrolase)